jgi:hypothetical protein
MAQRGRINIRSGRLPQEAAGSSGDPPTTPSDPPPEMPEWLEQVRFTVEKEAPILQAVLKRAIDAVLQFTALSDSAIANAAEAPTNLAVLLRALSSPELLNDLRQADPLAPAFIRGIDATRRLISDHGGSLTAAQAAATLGIAHQMVNKRRQAGKLLAISTGKHGYHYPVWQFHNSGVLSGLEDVLKVLAPHDSWMQVAFFVSRNERLSGQTPIEALKAGKLNPVLDAAAVYVEHGAE